MPELPEVETVRKGLQERLNFFCVEEAEVFRESSIASPGGAKEFTKKVRGSLIGDWKRRGKYLITTLHKETYLPSKKATSKKIYGWLVVHLRMTGHFVWNEKILPPCPYTRVRFWNKQRQELRFVDIRSFGQMWWIPSTSSPEEIIAGLKKLGPEPFQKEFNPLYLKNQISGKARPIKSALLDQTLVAGIGNIYADESLFLAGVCPRKPSGTLKDKELEKICLSIVKVLKISIGKGGTTFSDFRDLDGLNGNYGGASWVYRRGGEPCRKCGTKIYREKISGRSTHWCPQCQN